MVIEINKLQYSNRIKQIEDSWDASIKDILYQMHWGEDMMHKKIGKILNIPRPTITRWFRELDIPSQSCRRFTDRNLTNWFYKTGKLKKKIRYNGPDRRIQRTKGNVNVDFFKKWSPQMVYVLGFFAADGGMFINSEGSKYIQFVSTDKEILIKIKKLMDSNHKIGIKKQSLSNIRWKKCYLIQIGSKEMYNDLLKLGFIPNKDKTLKFPKVPDKYLNHFIRGYFDGDGSVFFGTYKRKSRKNRLAFYMRTCFVCGNKFFLMKLSRKLQLNTSISKGYLQLKSHERGYQLSYSHSDTKKLFEFMYREVDSPTFCYLERKYNKFLSALKIKGT